MRGKIEATSTRRKLLVATVGVGAVSYVTAIGCQDNSTSGNLPAPPPTATSPTSGNLPAPPPRDAAPSCTDPDTSLLDAAASDAAASDAAASDAAPSDAASDAEAGREPPPCSPK